LQEHGHTDVEALKALQNMRLDYKDDSEVTDLAVYHRLDHSKSGYLMPGYGAADVALNGLDKTVTSVHALMQTCRKEDGEYRQLVLIAGSIS
jgi:hypothetical protein